MKKILGLDIGTNSIGWAFIESNAYEKPETLDGRILQLGSRIIPMDADSMNKFESGNPESKAAGRRQARGARRLIQRYKLRRTRLIQALKILGWIPENFPSHFKSNLHHHIGDFLPFSESLKSEAARFFSSAKQTPENGQPLQVSEDWIIYFLKEKAKHEKVSLQELARILYHYNQRRGFKSSRKDAKVEEEITDTKYPLYEKWVEMVTIQSIKENGKGEGKDRDFTFYEIACKTPELEFTLIQKRKTPPFEVGNEVEVEISKKTTKDKQVSYSIAKVDPNAWENRKKALEKDLDFKEQTISSYFLHKLKSEPHFRIKDRIVDRSRYQTEFKLIWEKQSEFYQAEFSDKQKIAAIADCFYVHNKEKNKELKARDLFHLFYNDIIYYQRALRSQKALLANCQFEYKTYKTSFGTEQAPVKVTSRSSPAFQEFRIWQTIHNLRIIRNEEIVDGKLRINTDVTVQYLNVENKEKLFELFDKNAEVSHDSILRTLGFKKEAGNKGEKSFGFRLNYADDKPFPGNETKALFRKVFRKHQFEEQAEEYLNNEKKLFQLWHIVYSLPEEIEIFRALANKKYFDFPEAVSRHISKLPEFPRQYASISHKAINKLLPLMRVGKYWRAEDVNVVLQGNARFRDLDKALSDPALSEAVKKEIVSRNLRDIYDFAGLPTYLSAYIIYGRHSESVNHEKYDSPDAFDINKIIPHNSLRNPVVEKTIRETLKLVKDIWKNEKLGRPDFIHVELGRELRNNNEERKKIAAANTNNRIERERIVQLLKELNCPNFNANSPFDTDKFRIWKEAAGTEGDELFEGLFKKNKTDFVKDADIERYRHWAEQNYRSPYTGRPIPLSELFSEKYQVDHIIPRARFYDDSFANKVVVEAEVNALKDNMLAMPFIESFQGRDINLTNGQKIRVLPVKDYLVLSDELFRSRKKQKFLKLNEVPEDFVERQLNDTKYISRTIAQFLIPVAIGSETDPGLVYSSGQITSDLKNKWGLNKLWKEILRPRFERLEGILNEQLILPAENGKNDFHFLKSIKRLDHRHHALDALIIACSTRAHIKYLNSLNSLSNNKADIARYDQWQQWKYLLNKQKQLENKENGMTEFALPWNGFYNQAKTAIESIIVSHKPTAKLVSKVINNYQKWVEIEPGKWEKKRVKQEKPESDDKYWVGVKQAMFALPLGTVTQAQYKKNVEIKQAIKAQLEFKKSGAWNSDLWRIAKTDYRKKIDKIIDACNLDLKLTMNYIQDHPLLDADGQTIESLDLLQFITYASKRRSIDESFKADVIKKMPGSEISSNWLTRLLRDHLIEYENSETLAFKGEGLEQLYRKAGRPINKVTVLDGEAKNKIRHRNYLLEGVAGVNQYFIVEVYTETDKKTGNSKTVRKYSTPAFLDCIERLGKGLPIHDLDPAKQYFVLSPGDLVYVPREDEPLSTINWDDKNQIASRIYIMKSSQDSLAYFLPATVSSLIKPYDAKIGKGEFESMNKSERTIDGKQIIKERFIKLRVDRLGNISPAI